MTNIFAAEHTISLISDRAPRAMSAYFMCLYAETTCGKIIFDRDFITHSAVKSWTKFKNDIRTLARLFILNYDDRGKTIEIEMISEDD